MPLHITTLHAIALGMAPVAVALIALHMTARTLCMAFATA
jgi:hypothetical protein